VAVVVEVVMVVVVVMVVEEGWREVIERRNECNSS
jgi:hypothetical protein